jgi:predicted nuclease of predicted toxin-antitoxin system
MKFIVDAQIPKLISDYLCSQNHDCIHTLQLPNKNRTTDKEIISIALREERVVLTKDSDFLESFILRNQPPKLVLIKTGNIENSLLLSILEKYLQQICKELLLHSLIEITRTEMIVHG